MLQEDYISSCTLGLQGDYTFGVKGFRGLALRPCRRIVLLPAKNTCKAQGVLPSLLYAFSRKCCSKRDFTYGSVRDSFYYNNGSWSNSPQCCNTLQLEYRGWAWAVEQCLLSGLQKAYSYRGKLSASVKAGRNGHFVTVWCFWNADILAKAIISWPAQKTFQEGELIPKMQQKPSRGPHCTHWQVRDYLSFKEVLQEVASSYPNPVQPLIYLLWILND